MATTTIISKGQMTLPKEIRDALNVGAGDRLAVRLAGDGTVILEPETVPIASLFGRLKPPRGRRLTIADMERVISRGGRGR